MTLLDGMKEDMVTFLNEWGEMCSVKRSTPTIIAGTGGITEDVWTEVDTGLIDPQPVSGSALFEIEKLNIKSTHRIQARFDLDVQAKDRVEIGSTHYTVDHIKTYEDHLVIYGTKVGV